MKLIVGLGNPGPKYAGTRHNLGFDVLDELARRRDLAFGSSPAEALMARDRGLDAHVMLAKPTTFMNRSGEAVGTLSRYFRVDPGDVLIIVDDTNLPLGRLRARSEGSEGGTTDCGPSSKPWRHGRFRGCDWVSGEVTCSVISLTTCWPGSRTKKSERSRKW